MPKHNASPFLFVAQNLGTIVHVGGEVIAQLMAAGAGQPASGVVHGVTLPVVGEGDLGFTWTPKAK